MTTAKAGGVFSVLCALGLLAHATHAAEAPAVKKYEFELQTLNLGAAVRRKQVEFTVDDAMSDDEVAAVTAILDELEASPPDAAGYRGLALPNGTRMRIGGFDEVESGGAIRSMPVELAAADEFSTLEAALVLRIAAAGNLFVASLSDSERVATPGAISDRRFQRAHKRAAVTPDEATLAEWVRQNISSSPPPPD